MPLQAATHFRNKQGSIYERTRLKTSNKTQLSAKDFKLPAEWQLAWDIATKACSERQMIDKLSALGLEQTQCVDPSYQQQDSGITPRGLMSSDEAADMLPLEDDLDRLVPTDGELAIVAYGSTPAGGSSTAELWMTQGAFSATGEEGSHNYLSKKTISGVSLSGNSNARIDAKLRRVLTRQKARMDDARWAELRERYTKKSIVLPEKRVNNFNVAVYAERLMAGGTGATKKALSGAAAEGAGAKPKTSPKASPKAKASVRVASSKPTAVKSVRKPGAKAKPGSAKPKTASKPAETLRLAEDGDVFADAERSGLSEKTRPPPNRPKSKAAPLAAGKATAFAKAPSTAEAAKAESDAESDGAEEQGEGPENPMCVGDEEDDLLAD